LAYFESEWKSSGSVDNDSAMVESFWGRMQVELFSREAWKTRINLATAIHDQRRLTSEPRDLSAKPGGFQRPCPIRLRSSLRRTFDRGRGMVTL
jgi:hypothetical protein